jgi:hypothetical protein
MKMPDTSVPLKSALWTMLNPPKSQLQKHSQPYEMISLISNSFASISMTPPNLELLVPPEIYRESESLRLSSSGDRLSKSW